MHKNKPNTKKTIIILFALVITIIGYLWWGNASIVTTHINAVSSKLPDSFDGFVITQISDLHNAGFGEGQSRLLAKVSDSHPDIIAITGDLIDANRTDIDVAMEFIEKAVKIAKVYYVTGNHEAWSDGYEELKSKLSEAGVIILDDEAETLSRGDDSIHIIGLNDPYFTTTSDWLDESRAVVYTKLSALVDTGCFNVLLSHRPEFIDIYAQCEVDLTLTGHAHGGQIRIPFIGGLVAPNQGLFPKYTAGVYKNRDTQMIVSRGLGNSILPLRINNRPEVVVVTLKKVLA